VACRACAEAQHAAGESDAVEEVTSGRFSPFVIPAKAGIYAISPPSRGDSVVFGGQNEVHNAGMNSETHALILQNDSLRCVLRPDLGGSIASLCFQGIPILLEAKQQNSVRDMGSFPLVPFSNRVAKAQLQWQGTHHPLVQLGAIDEHAIHGIAWQKPWQVLDTASDFAMLSYEHKADQSWPFAFDVSQTFKLSKDALHMTLSVTNQAPTAAPMGLGWHPYFAKREGMRLQFAATSRWDVGLDMLPTQQIALDGVDADCQTLNVDNCFEGWGGSAVLSDPELSVQVDSNLPRLVVFTKPSKNAVAIEPVSHTSNGFNQTEPELLGVRILQSGESWSVQMSISVARS
jgi:aldose 1-epimerase